MRRTPRHCFDRCTEHSRQMCPQARYQVSDGATATLDQEEDERHACERKRDTIDSVLL
jgi:hypothetical protein